MRAASYEALDPTGIDRPFLDGQALVPHGAAELVEACLQDDAVRARVRRIEDQERAYYVMIASGIDLRAVASLRPAGAHASFGLPKPHPDEDPPRRPRLLDPDELPPPKPPAEPAKKV